MGNLRGKLTDEEWYEREAEIAAKKDMEKERVTKRRVKRKRNEFRRDK